MSCELPRGAPNWQKGSSEVQNPLKPPETIIYKNSRQQDQQIGKLPNRNS